jgi:prepilin-type N-terminal cleavage/methylation domain-containing protein
VGKKKQFKKKNKKGFTLIELIITVVIVAVLAMVSLPIYRRYVRQATATEGKALLGEIAAAQEIFFSRYGQYYAGTSGVDFATAVGVDPRRNKFFRGFNVSVADGGESYTVTTSNEDGDIELTMDGSRTAAPVISEDYKDE